MKHDVRFPFINCKRFIRTRGNDDSPKIASLEGIGASSAEGSGVGITNMSGVGSGVRDPVVWRSLKSFFSSSVPIDSSNSESTPESVGHHYSQ